MKFVALNYTQCRLFYLNIRSNRLFLSRCSAQTNKLFVSLSDCRLFVKDWDFFFLCWPSATTELWELNLLLLVNLNNRYLPWPFVTSEIHASVLKRASVRFNSFNDLYELISFFFVLVLTVLKVLKYLDSLKKCILIATVVHHLTRNYSLFVFLLFKITLCVISQDVTFKL